MVDAGHRVTASLTRDNASLNRDNARGSDCQNATPVAALNPPPA